MPFKNGNYPANKKFLDKARVLALYESGLSTNKIAKLLGCHKSLVSKLLKDEGLLRYRRMNPEQQAEMVRQYQAGESGPVVAKRFGTTAPAVYLALDRAGVERRTVADYDYEEPNIQHDFFDSIDTEEIAYWLGFITGDGCVTRSDEIVLSLSAKDADHVELWRATIGSNATCSVLSRPKQFGKYEWGCGTARVTIRSRRLAAALAEKGVVPAKTGQTTYPSGIPDDLEPHFWRGLVDADGTLFWGRKSPGERQFVLSLTGDRPIVARFRDFCCRRVPTKAHIQPNGPSIVKFSVTDSYAMAIARVLYAGAKIALARKLAIFQAADCLFASRGR